MIYMKFMEYVSTFVFYLFMHSYIGLIWQDKLKGLNNKSTNKDKRNVKLWGYAFRWFPALFVLLFLLSCYT